MGNAKICDFGLCKKFSTKDDKVVGTIQYSAPEIYSEFGYSYEIDFWSLGILIFYLLTFDYPFKTIKNAINDRLPDLNEKSKIKNKQYEISQVTSNFVSKLLKKNPKKRLGSSNLDENIRNDPYFDTIDWIKLENGELTPPFKPKQVKILLILKSFKNFKEIFFIS